VQRLIIIENTFHLLHRERVINYIDCTKKHFSNNVYEDKDLNLFLDFDLYTFSFEDFNDYMIYGEGITYEFTHHLTLDSFLEGRTNFLSGVLEKNALYRTTEFFDKFEENAKNNIRKEIEYLKSKK
jgi:predicted metal-dependent HD superfamily phosphohydrolase